MITMVGIRWEAEANNKEWLTLVNVSFVSSATFKGANVSYFVKSKCIYTSWEKYFMIRVFNDTVV